MALTPRGEVSYNVQVAVDSQHHVMVEQEVTNEVLDNCQLLATAESAKAILRQDQLNVVTDKGYYHHEQIKACQEAGITPYISKPQISKNIARGLFPKEKFIYEPDGDCYRCPAAKPLTFRYQMKERGQRFRYYRTDACRDCQLRVQCTTDKKGRRIKRWEHEAILEQMAERVRSPSRGDDITQTDCRASVRDH